MRKYNSLGDFNDFRVSHIKLLGCWRRYTGKLGGYERDFQLFPHMMKIETHQSQSAIS